MRCKCQVFTGVVHHNCLFILQVVELVSGAGLYIPAKQLANCRKESRSITTLVNSLVRCIFTKEARELCSAVGNERVKGSRPGLHRRSLSIILSK